uniref:G-protein alpha subunit n=2 Tax=Parascaris univalens TaxID=6257 RepID=A0A915CJQ3_PARUN
MCSRQRYGAGAGESGKSTVLKQMKIIHDNGYSPDEALQKKSMVHANAIQSIGAILNGMHELKIPLASPKNQDYARFIQGIIARKEELGPMTKEIYTAIKQLWADKSVQVAFTRKDEYYLNDSARYFLDSLERIYDPKYIPTEQDILHTRVATMGVIEVTFTMKNKIWRVFDVGGQRSQRKKWIHCFDDAKAVIFVAALSEYDQLLSEDNATNRIQESLQLFKQVCNSRYFIETNMILFLNKKDLFMEKIGKGRSLKIAFPEYSGPETYEACSKYIEKKFFMANEVPNKLIYCHHTCATDTQQVQFVLDSVLDTILSNKLKGCGLY